jgi:hypothetical protein
MLHSINKTAPPAYILAAIKDFHRDLYHRLLAQISNPLNAAAGTISEIVDRDESTELGVVLDLFSRFHETRTVVCPGMRSVLLANLNTLHRICKTHIKSKEVKALAERVIGTIGDGVILDGQRSPEFVKYCEDDARRFDKEWKDTTSPKRKSDEVNPMIRHFSKKARSDPPRLEINSQEVD